MNIRNLKSEFKNLKLKFGGLAQLARAPALHAGGQRFDSVILHKAPPDLPKVEVFRMLTLPLWGSWRGLKVH